MRTSTPDITRSVTPDGDVLVIEAVSVEDALAAVPESTEDDVLDVERVLRGGVGGFFAKEMFVVTLRPPGTAVHELTADDAFEGDDDTDEVPDRYVVDARPTGIDAVLAQMSLEEDAREMSFGALLQQHMRPLATSSAAVPAPAPDPAPALGEVAPAPAPETAAPQPPTLRHPIEGRRPSVRAWTPPRLDAVSPAPAPAPAPAPVAAPAPAPAPAPSPAPVDPAPGSLASVLAKALASEVAPAPVAPTSATAPELPDGVGLDAAVWNLDVTDASADIWSALAPVARPEPRTAEAEVVADLLEEPVDAEIVDEPQAVARPSLPTPVLPTPVTRDALAERHASTGTAWSVEELLALGIPDTLLGDLPPIDADDEYAWMRALAAAVSPLCRPLPAGQSLLAGATADRLAEALGVPLVGQAPFLDAETAAVVLRNDEGSRSWFAHARSGRWLHVVVGGGPIVTAPTDDTLAVSWVGDDALPQALTLAARHGLVLGFGLDPSRGSTGLRAHPIDVAVAIRRLLPRRTA